MRLPNVILQTHLLAILFTTASFTNESVVVPHDARLGHIIKKYHFRGQTFALFDSELSNSFVILNNGILMLTSDISHRIGKPIHLFLKEEFPENTLNSILVIHVKRKNNMMKLDKDFYTGAVFENLPSGTLVKGLENIFVSGKENKVTCSISSESGDNAFSITPSPYNRETAIAIVTNHPLDREEKPAYRLKLRIFDNVEADSTEAILYIDILDVNDNPPIPEKYFYEFQVKRNTKMFSVIGNIQATDKDDDRPVYKFQTRHPKFIIIPKTGQILLSGMLEQKTYQLIVQIHDNRISRKYSQDIFLIIRETPREPPVIDRKTLFDIIEDDTKHLVRSKRSVRPTKSYVYNESDGSTVNQTMFSLEKKDSEENFQIEGSNRWVEIDKSGIIRVKEPWNYEQLGKEKTIDFWVLITQPGALGTQMLRGIIIARKSAPIEVMLYYMFCSKVEKKTVSLPWEPKRLNFSTGFTMRSGISHR